MPHERVYIAAPFFNDRQLEIVEHIKSVLSSNNILYFSPKDESMFKQGDNPIDILNLNVEAIVDSDYIIVVTDGKDTGTIWEAGYAFGKGIPILYLWVNRREGQKFNLMLGASGNVVNTFRELDAACEDLSYATRLTNDFRVDINYE